MEAREQAETNHGVGNRGPDYAEIAWADKHWKPHRTDNDAIAREQERFDRAQELIKAGKLEEARAFCWWPKNEDPPKEHWSRKGVHVCSCGKQSADGVYGLCGYCGGTTPQTPSLVVRRLPGS